MDCMMRGTPAMTWTFSIEKPGAMDASLSISTQPRGIVAMRWRASLKSLGGTCLA